MKNRLKEKLSQNQKVFGVMMQMESAAAAEGFGAAGLDFCVIDTEHAPIDSESMRRIVTAAEVRNVTPLCASSVSRPSSCRQRSISAQWASLRPA
jgi:4-hydroxy-2-oxoheptanedioate aldolase